MKKYIFLLLIQFVTIVFASSPKDSTLFTEDFENVTFPPTGWTLNNTGAGFIEATTAGGGYIHSGEKAAAHMDDVGPQDDWLITPLISIPAGGSATITFWETVYWVQYMNGVNEVGVSTDGGATFTIVWQEDAAYVAANIIDGEYIAASASLQAYVGQDVHVGIHYTGDYGCQWYIDDVEIMHDFQGPTITNLVGNEALLPIIGTYTNNDLTLNLTANDLLGVKSITGHYTYDGGIIVTDISFVKAKAGDELWIATIPAEALPKLGTINFDLVDLADTASPTTMDYDHRVFHQCKV